MVDIITNGFRNIIRKKLRFSLTIMGIAIGVMSVVIISTIGDVGKLAINNELNSLGIDGLAVSVDKKYENASLENQDIKAIKNSELVVDAMPLMMHYTSSMVLGKENGTLAWGIDDSAKNIVELNVLYGRLINKFDVENKSDVCVVDEVFAKSVYKRSNIVGKKINLKFKTGYRKMEVIGVVESGGAMLQNLMGDYIPSFMYIPYTTLEKYQGETNFSQVAVKLKNGVNSQIATKQLKSEIETFKGVSNSIVVENLNTQKEKLNGVLNIITLILSVIAGISLIVAGLSIMTVMLVSVHERTREIGIKKSIGASKSLILFEFIVECFLISIIGSFIGVATGVLISFLGCQFVGVKFILNINMIIFCTCFAVIISIVFGVYPALKASNLKPVDALRTD